MKAKKQGQRIFRSLATLVMILTVITTMTQTRAEAAEKKVPAQVVMTGVKAGVTSAGKNKVTISWKKAANATSYRLYYKKNGATKWTVLTTTKNTSYTQTDSKKAPLTDGNKYIYVVRGYNNQSKQWSKQTSKGKSVTMSVTPEIVTLKSIKATAANKVALTWNKAKNATSYKVFYKISGAKTWTGIATVRETSYTHTSSSKFPLEAGKKYVYSIRSYNSGSKRWSGYSKATAVTMPAAIPGIAKNIAASTTGNSITLTWDKVNGATDYYIYSKEPGNSYVKCGTAKTTRFTIKKIGNTPIRSGRSYYFSVRAYKSDSKRWGAYSQMVQANTKLVDPISLKLDKNSLKYAVSSNSDVSVINLIPTPAYASLENVTVESSDENVVIISDHTAEGNYYLTRTGTGIADVTFTLPNGKKVVCKVTVENPEVTTESETEMETEKQTASVPDPVLVPEANETMIL